MDEFSINQALPPPPSCPNGFIHVVQPGETLFSIAQRFGASLNAVIAANPQLTNPNAIFPGQQICVPTAPVPPPPPPPACPGFFHVVQSGETLFGIAQRFGTTVNAILAVNPSITNPNLIFPGQRICIPTGPVPPPPPPSPACPGFFHVVQGGETLFGIAQRFGTTVNAILAVNPSITNPNLIFPGQRICIP